MNCPEKSTQRAIVGTVVRKGLERPLARITCADLRSNRETVEAQTDDTSGPMILESESDKTHLEEDGTDVCALAHDAPWKSEQITKAWHENSSKF